MMSENHSQHRPIILNLPSSRTYSEYEHQERTSSHVPNEFPSFSASKLRGSVPVTFLKERSRIATNSSHNVALLPPIISKQCTYTNDVPSQRPKKLRSCVSVSYLKNRSRTVANSPSRVTLQQLNKSKKYETPSHRPKSDNGTSSKSRKFSASWKHAFPFLEHNPEENLMFCRVCRRFSGPTHQKMPFVAGTSNFWSSSIAFHENSVLHWKCIKLQEEEITSSRQLFDEDEKRLAEVIRTVYFMVKTRSPFSDFPQLCRAQKELGLHLGPAYTSHQAIVPIFAKYITNNLEKDMVKELKGVGAFSLIIDSSLTRVSENHQLVHIKHFREGSVKTNFLGVVDSSGSSDYVFQNINNLFNKFGFVDWVQKVVYVFIDAWSSSPSWYESFVDILREKSSNNFICDFNFVPHKLTCCSKLFSENMLMDTFYSLIYDIFWYYKNLPEDTRTLVYVNKELDTILLTYGNLPKNMLACFSFEAFEAVNKDWVSLVLILKKYTDSILDPKTRSVGIKILQSVRTSKFLWTLALVLDISECLADFSNKIGESDFMLFSLLLETKETHRKLLKAVAGNGQHVYQFRKDMCSKYFRNIEIRLDADLAEVVAQVQYPGGLMTEQVSRFSEKLSWLKDSIVADTRQWPRGDLDLAHFGDSEFSKLYSGTYENLATALFEWRTLKNNVLLCFPPDVLDVPRVAVPNMIDVFRTELPIATSLMERLLLLDLSSDDLSRVFRETSQCKSSARSRLSASSLHSLVTIAVRGPEVTNFDPAPVLRDWMEERPRRHRNRKRVHEEQQLNENSV